MSSFLTERQKAILDFIQDFRRRRGVAPTHREICEHFGFSSYGTAYKHLKLLVEKGYLRRDRHQRRGLEVTGGDAATAGEELPLLGRIAAGRPIETVPPGDSLVIPRQLLGERTRDHYGVCQTPFFKKFFHIKSQFLSPHFLINHVMSSPNTHPSS